jgi:DNA-binding SARP family transcriptional activator
MSGELRIALLGPLAVAIDGQPLADNAWRSRQERRLLGILLTARGKRVPTERLLDWLWPGADPAAAAITLRSAISGLRHALEPDGGARASSRYVVTRPGGYAWNLASGAWIDVEEFLALTSGPKAASGTSAAPAPSADAPAALERAVALYRGDYLADEPDAPWADDLRESLRERFLSALHDLAALRLDAGDYDAAIALARRGLEHDRLREPLYRALMRAQAQAGDIASALQSYERCRRALDEELGAAPSPQTRDLHAAILRGEISRSQYQRIDERGSRVEARIARPPILDPSSSIPRQLARSPADPPFVGRAPELAALQGWIAALDQRRGGVVAILGESGIGKTRLVSEALRSASGGAITIVLRCAPLERGLPFAALSEALRPILRSAPIETLRRLPAVALAQVADLLPLLRERLPDLPPLPAAPPAEGRNYLLDGVVDLALALAREQPLIIWCDDAQWADEATLAAIGRLARRAPRQALLIILAYRSEELVENAALHTLLRSLGREMSLRPLVLGRLGDAEMTELLAGLAQAPPERVARLAPRLGASVGGNPLFLSVAVQSLIEARGARSLAALLPDLDQSAPLPDLASAPPLRDLVLSRLERLPAGARALLEQLAAIGRPVSLDLIEQLAGPPALDAARTLLERQLLVEGDDGRIEFGHDLVRSIVAASLSSPQRRLLHRRAAEAIAALYGDQPERAAELAFHFEQAGRGVEAETLRYALAAGDYARASFGYREALGHYDAALWATERMGARAPADLTRRAFAGRLLMHEALLDWDGIMATAARYERWSAARPGQPPLVTLRRLVLLRALMGDLAGAARLSGEQARRQSDAPAAIDDMLRRTAVILEPAEPPLQKIENKGGEAEEGSSSAILYPRFRSADPPPGAPADDLPALLGPEEAALALFQVGWALLTQGLVRDAEPCLLRAYELAGATSQAAVAVVSALQLAHLGALRGDGVATEQWISTSLKTAQRAPEAAWASIWPRIHQAFLLLLDDRYEDARIGFEQMAARLHDLPAFQSHRASVQVGLGLLDLAAGKLDRAAERLHPEPAARQSLYGFVYVAAQHGLARIAALRASEGSAGGDLAPARALLAHALDYSARRSLLPEYVRSAIEVARIERDFGEAARARPLIEAAADRARSAGLAPLAEAAAALSRRLASS